MNFNTPNVQLPQLHAFIILQCFLLWYYLVLGQWVMRAAVRACVCSRSPRAGSAGRKPGGAQRGRGAPALLSRQSDLKKMLYAFSAPVSSLRSSIFSTYLLKIWVRVFMGFGVLLGNILFNSFSFFASVFKLLHVKYADVLFCNCSYNARNVTEMIAGFLTNKKKKKKLVRIACDLYF